MPANGRWDLIPRLKVKGEIQATFLSTDILFLSARFHVGIFSLNEMALCFKGQGTDGLCRAGREESKHVCVNEEVMSLTIHGFQDMKQ